MTSFVRPSWARVATRLRICTCNRASLLARNAACGPAFEDGSPCSLNVDQACGTSLLYRGDFSAIVPQHSSSRILHQNVSPKYGPPWVWCSLGKAEDDSYTHTCTFSCVGLFFDKFSVDRASGLSRSLDGSSAKTLVSGRGPECHAYAGVAARTAARHRRVLDVAEACSVACGRGRVRARAGPSRPQSPRDARPGAYGAAEASRGPPLARVGSQLSTHQGVQRARLQLSLCVISVRVGHWLRNTTRGGRRRHGGRAVRDPCTGAPSALGLVDPT